MWTKNRLLPLASAASPAATERVESEVRLAKLPACVTCRFPRLVAASKWLTPALLACLSLIGVSLHASDEEMRKAEELYQTKSFREAATLLEGILEREPANGLAHRLLGHSRYALPTPYVSRPWPPRRFCCRLDRGSSRWTTIAAP